MKLIRLKINDPNGFRSLQPGFECNFRTFDEAQDETDSAPFVCAGPNGSGKSNLLEALAAIFFQIEIIRLKRSFVPTALEDRDTDKPRAYELEYLIKAPNIDNLPARSKWAHVRITKALDRAPQLEWIGIEARISEREKEFLLPDFILAYSSGENEILSLPFFKMRFIQFDEYWNHLKERSIYPGRPETRLAYADLSLSQAILLCNLLFQKPEVLEVLQRDIGLGDLHEFRIIIKRSIEVVAERTAGFMSDNPALTLVNDEDDQIRYQINLMELLEANDQSAKNFDPIITRLKRCATASFLDHKTDTLYLDFSVNDASKRAFRENFDGSPVALFQAFQVLFALNLYSVSEKLKTDLYKSSSYYVSETVPILASDERIVRFKFVSFEKQGVKDKLMLKNLSDGEHQLLHSLGLCLLFGHTNSLFLLDEPETHFNPDWRSKFISRIMECLPKDSGEPELLITTHTPFLISDSRQEKVLEFSRTSEGILVEKAKYNTFGASINKISIATFCKKDTIGDKAKTTLARLREQFFANGDRNKIMAEIETLGDSVEKILLIKEILDKEGATL